MSVTFVDTNILVYRYDSSEPAKQKLASAWLETLWRTRTGRTSRQVLHELYVTLTRKVSRPLDPSAARTVTRSLEAWGPVESSAVLLTAAWLLEDRYSLSFWDALIVAAAHEVNASVLLTEDLQDGMAIDSLTIVNPFIAGPPAGLVHDG